MAGSRPRATALTSVATVVALLLLVGALWAFVIVDFNRASGGAANASTNAGQTSGGGSDSELTGASDADEAEGGWTMDDAREALAAEGSRTLVLTDSTGDGYDEWVHLWAANEELPVATWDAASESGYSDEDASTRVWSAGAPGANGTYPTERWDALWPAQDPDLVIISYGHADDVAQEATDALETLHADLTERAPGVPIVVVLANPSANDANVHVREGIAQWAEDSGLPTIDVAQAFKDSEYAPEDLLLDAYHPSSTASELWAQTVGEALA